ncbi:MAG: chemotaxis-specific protein-glutamate methyltransferase CheB [Gammaproteobacteria bacterium]
MTDKTKSGGGRNPPIKVLVVEDSPTIREFLIFLLASDPGIEVVGTATNGEEALVAVKARQPDIVTMDLHMPKMNGLDATRTIMEDCPLPIVIVTGSASAAEMESTLSALESGALAVMKRPAPIGHSQHTATARELIQTVKLMSEVKVVRRWRKKSDPTAEPRSSPQLMSVKPLAEIRLIAMGASTGGPMALQQILSALPKNFPIPIIIVQHIAEGFTENFAEWLMQSAGFPVSMAGHEIFMHPGHAYVAPNGCQTTVDGTGRIRLQAGMKTSGHCPSISGLFHSVAEAYGPHAVGVLLTGMGRDGARELGLMKKKGAVTIAQDMESCVVYGMPREAVAIGSASLVLTPDKIAAALVNIANS